MSTNKLPKLAFERGEAIKAYRSKHKMNQTEFWSNIQVTQSGGSRYESGRGIPKTVQLLLTVAYGSDRMSQNVVEALRTRRD